MTGLPDQESTTESSDSGQITLSVEQLNAIITNAVAAALQTTQSTQPQVTMPEIPKLITVQGLGTGVLEIDIVMSSSLFMLITYYSIMTDTYECD